MMVKPASQGSSVGITKVKTAAELPRAYAEARSVDPIVFAERFIAGDESRSGCCRISALPSIRIEPATEFYDYQAKYFRDDTQYHCPSGLDAPDEARAASRGARRIPGDRLQRLGPGRLHARSRPRRSSISSKSTRRRA